MLIDAFWLVCPILLGIVIYNIFAYKAGFRVVSQYEAQGKRRKESWFSSS
jgi:hypothetical protein